MAEYMCPNCVTPWKCNGPHIPESSAAQVPSQKGTDETGGAANPASAAGPTPRTDAFWKQAYFDDDEYQAKLRTLCRQLERELAAANVKIAELEGNERAYERIIGPKSYQEVADELANERRAREEAERNYRFMVERAANEKLDGYRELGAKCVAAEERAEAAERDFQTAHAYGVEQHNRAEAAEQDAKRIDFLESALLRGAELSSYVNFIRLEHHGLHKESTLRAAIDSAMKG
jgi:hypothetical protein